MMRAIGTGSWHLRSAGNMTACRLKRDSATNSAGAVPFRSNIGCLDTEGEVALRRASPLASERRTFYHRRPRSDELQPEAAHAKNDHGGNERGERSPADHHAVGDRL